MRHLTSLRYIDAVTRQKSIRKASESMAITATALNRRILAIEAELGEPIFERLPSGMRLNAAGEIFIEYIRKQFADLERVRSQIADLSGMRRGHVRIVSTEEMLHYFLPKQIADYRLLNPAVTFEIDCKTAAEAELALKQHHSDIALIAEPLQSAYFYTMAQLHQPIICMMHKNHPLTHSNKPLYLQDCIDYPLVLPKSHSHLRILLNKMMVQKNLPITHQLESNSFEFIYAYLHHENAISFQFPINLNPEDTEFITRPLHNENLPTGILNIGHLNGRVLPVAAAKFLEYSVRFLHHNHPHAIIA